MLTWVERDENGTEYLVRAGRGHVLGLIGLGEPTATGTVPQFDSYRVEIGIQPPADMPQNIPFRVSPTVSADQASLIAAAIEAYQTNQPVEWRVEWSRLDDVPADMPIDQAWKAKKTRAVLMDLRIEAAMLTVDEDVFTT